MFDRLNPLLRLAALTSAATMLTLAGVGCQKYQPGEFSITHPHANGNNSNSSSLIPLSGNKSAVIMPTKNHSKPKAFANAAGNGGPQLVFGGGPLISHVNAINVFWGTYYNGNSFTTSLNSFVQYLVGSPVWLSQITQYNV